MNNSFARLIDGMVEVLRRDVIPAMDGEFARGQAYGVIFMLESLKLRGDWSSAFLGEQVAALQALHNAIAAAPDLPAAMPIVSAPAAPDIASRDLGDSQVADLIDWLAAQPSPHPAIQSAIDAYLTRQIRHELTTSARPMFAEISLGRETDKDH
ncbi:hypothetical protein [Sphingopyxis sp.]|uniref:hypothetical protein n=1 Tax=Sphingopyxis sp. TaxID=1908224 RepID=UPI003D10431E